MRSSRFGQLVTNLIGVAGLAMIVLSYFAVASSGQESAYVELLQANFCPDGVGAGAKTCNAAACMDETGCIPDCSGQICNVGMDCICQSTRFGCRCVPRIAEDVEGP